MERVIEEEIEKLGLKVEEKIEKLELRVSTEEVEKLELKVEEKIEKLELRVSTEEVEKLRPMCASSSVHYVWHSGNTLVMECAVPRKSCGEGSSTSRQKGSGG